MGVDGAGNIFVAYSDTTSDTEGDLYVASSANGGGSFSYTLAADSTYRGQTYPKLFVDANDYIHLMWNDNRDNKSYGSVYYTRSIDGGTSYATNVSIRSSGGMSNGSLYVDSGTVDFVTTDYLTSPFSTIFYWLSWLTTTAPVITSEGTAIGTVNQPFSYQINATNNPTSFGASGLPTWLSIDQNTGLLLGTATNSGTFTVLVTAANAGGTGGNAVTITIVVAFPLTVANSGSGSGTIASLPSGIDCGTTCNASFPSGTSVTLTATSATGSTFTGWGGACTNASGTCTVSMTAAQSVTAMFALSGTVPGAPTIGTATAGNARATVSFTGPTNTGGSPITGYTVTSSPGGITASGAVSPITVTGLTNGMAYTFTATATNSVGTSAPSAPSNSVIPATTPGAPVITSASTASGTVNQFFSYQITATNSPTSYGASGLPAGLSINQSTGLISGTPTASGTFNVTVTATNAGGTGSMTVTITTTTLAATTLNLNPGWNLLGNTGSPAIAVQTDPSLSDSNKVTTVWKWNAQAAGWAFYAPSLAAGGTLATYAAGKGYQVLSTIEPGEGFWVNAAQAFTLTRTGITPFTLGPTYTGASGLVFGWNLVATSDVLSPPQIDTALGGTVGAPSFISMWAWSNSSSQWYFYAPSLAANGTLPAYIISKQYLDFATLPASPGLGFWLSSNINAIPVSVLTVSVTGTGVVSSNTTGMPNTITGCNSVGGAACSGTYLRTTAVTLAATPTGGSHFSGWSGGNGTCSGTTNPCTLALGATGVTATFGP